MYSSHALRHRFAVSSLSEAHGILPAVSRALGHVRPLITLNFYGHMAPRGFNELMGQVSSFVAPITLAAKLAPDADDINDVDDQSVDEDEVEDDEG